MLAHAMVVLMCAVSVWFVVPAPSSRPIGAPALLTVLSAVSNEGRGAVLGLNITFSSLGWIGATALGGVVLGFAGFGGLAILTFAFGLLGGVLALATWLLPRERARLLVARSEH